MEKEFNFKERLKNMTFGHENLQLKRNVEELFDEFIKRLKEELKPDRDYKTISYRVICEKIDKLAGSKLS